jgi:hypothetical protein
MLASSAGLRLSTQIGPVHTITRNSVEQRSTRSQAGSCDASHYANLHNQLLTGQVAHASILVSIQSQIRASMPLPTSVNIVTRG